MVDSAPLACGDLRPEEARLIAALREVSYQPLRDCLWGAIEEMLQFAARPGCDEAGAGGMPCVRVYVACDPCRRVSSAMQALKSRSTAWKAATP